jgi:hypothetical protein
LNHSQKPLFWSSAEISSLINKIKNKKDTVEENVSFHGTSVEKFKKKKELF